MENLTEIKQVTTNLCNLINSPSFNSTSKQFAAFAMIRMNYWPNGIQFSNLIVELILSNRLVRADMRELIFRLSRDNKGINILDLIYKNKDISLEYRVLSFAWLIILGRVDINSFEIPSREEEEPSSDNRLLKIVESAKKYTPDKLKTLLPHNIISTSLTDDEIKVKGHLIHKLKAKDTTGRWAYYFVLVEDEIESFFLKAIEGDGTIDLEDYGSVVGSCYGESPTQELKDYLKEKYNFDV